eukprot:gene11126-18746_t
MNQAPKQKMQQHVSLRSDILQQERAKARLMTEQQKLKVEEKSVREQEVASREAGRRRKAQHGLVDFRFSRMHEQELGVVRVGRDVEAPPPEAPEPEEVAKETRAMMWEKEQAKLVKAVKAQERAYERYVVAQAKIRAENIRAENDKQRLEDDLAKIEATQVEQKKKEVITNRGPLKNRHKQHELEAVFEAASLTVSHPLKNRHRQHELEAVFEATFLPAAPLPAREGDDDEDTPRDIPTFLRFGPPRPSGPTAAVASARHPPPLKPHLPHWTEGRNARLGYDDAPMDYIPPSGLPLPGLTKPPAVSHQEGHSRSSSGPARTTMSPSPRTEGLRPESPAASLSARSPARGDVSTARLRPDSPGVVVISGGGTGSTEHAAVPAEQQDSKLDPAAGPAAATRQGTPLSFEEEENDDANSEDLEEANCQRGVPTLMPLKVDLPEDIQRLLGPLPPLPEIDEDDDSSIGSYPMARQGGLSPWPGAASSGRPGRGGPRETSVQGEGSGDRTFIDDMLLFGDLGLGDYWIRSPGSSISIGSVMAQGAIASPTGFRTSTSPSTTSSGPAPVHACTPIHPYSRPQQPANSTHIRIPTTTTANGTATSYRTSGASFSSPSIHLTSPSAHSSMDTELSLLAREGAALATAHAAMRTTSYHLSSSTTTTSTGFPSPPVGAFSPTRVKNPPTSTTNPLHGLKYEYNHTYRASETAGSSIPGTSPGASVPSTSPSRFLELFGLDPALLEVVDRTERELAARRPIHDLTFNTNPSGVVGQMGSYASGGGPNPYGPSPELRAPGGATPARAAGHPPRPTSGTSSASLASLLGDLELGGLDLLAETAASLSDSSTSLATLQSGLASASLAEGVTGGASLSDSSVSLSTVMGGAGRQYGQPPSQSYASLSSASLSTIMGGASRQHAQALFHSSASLSSVSLLQSQSNAFGNTSTPMSDSNFSYSDSLSAIFASLGLPALDFEGPTPASPPGPSISASSESTSVSFSALGAASPTTTITTTTGPSYTTIGTSSSSTSVPTSFAQSPGGLAQSQSSSLASSSGLGSLDPPPVTSLSMLAQPTQLTGSTNITNYHQPTDQEPRSNFLTTNQQSTNQPATHTQPLPASGLASLSELGVPSPGFPNRPTPVLSTSLVYTQPPASFTISSDTSTSVTSPASTSMWPRSTAYVPSTDSSSTRSALHMPHADMSSLVTATTLTTAAAAHETAMVKSSAELPRSSSLERVATATTAAVAAVSAAHEAALYKSGAELPHSYSRENAAADVGSAAREAAHSFARTAALHSTLETGQATAPTATTALADVAREAGHSLARTAALYSTLETEQADAPTATTADADNVTTAREAARSLDSTAPLYSTLEPAPAAVAYCTDRAMQAASLEPLSSADVDDAREVASQRSGDVAYESGSGFDASGSGAGASGSGAGASGSGAGASGSGAGASRSGFGAFGSGAGASGSGAGASGSGFGASGSGAGASGSGFGASGSGAGASGSGFGASGSGSGFGASGSGAGASGSGFGALGSGAGASGSGAGASGSGFGTSGSGAGAYGSGFGSIAYGYGFNGGVAVPYPILPVPEEFEDLELPRERMSLPAMTTVRSAGEPSWTPHGPGADLGAGAGLGADLGVGVGLGADLGVGVGHGTDPDLGQQPAFFRRRDTSPSLAGYLPTIAENLPGASDTSTSGAWPIAPDSPNPQAYPELPTVALPLPELNPHVPHTSFDSQPLWGGKPPTALASDSPTMDSRVGDPHHGKGPRQSYFLLEGGPSPHSFREGSPSSHALPAPAVSMSPDTNPAGSPGSASVTPGRWQQLAPTGASPSRQSGTLGRGDVTDSVSSDGFGEIMGGILREINQGLGFPRVFP